MVTPLSVRLNPLLCGLWVRRGGPKLLANSSHAATGPIARAKAENRAPAATVAFTRKQNCATHAAGTPSDRQSDLAFQNLLFEAWPLARSPQLGDMRDAVA